MKLSLGFIILLWFGSPLLADDQRCSEMPETGFCKAAFTKYYFDTKSRSCQPFIWGGCGGHIPFHDKESCALVCEGGQASSLEQLDDSYQQWLLTRDKHEGRYDYVVSFQSWVGFGDRTTLYVDNGEVVRRDYVAWSAESPQDSQSWKESAETLGQHAAGAALKTIDELYQDCRSILTEYDGEDYQITLRFDGVGILKQCQFTHRQCADDCSEGILIGEGSWL